MEWRDISTAPKDGSFFIVNDAEEFYYDGAIVSSGNFGRPVVLYFFNGQFRKENSNCVYGGEVMTHWMPLPEAPKP